MSHSQLISPIYLSRLIKNVQIFPLSIMQRNTLIWSERTCWGDRSQGECSHQLLTFYATVTLMRQGQAKNTECYYVKIESKAETRGDIKAEMAFYERGREDETARREKSCKTTHSEEKAGDYFRWRSLHSSLFTVATADTRKHCAGQCRSRPVGVYKLILKEKKCLHAIISQSVQSWW